MRKIKNPKNKTLYSTLFPGLTSLSHKKPAKNTCFTPTESLQAPACQPPTPACLHGLSAKQVSEDRRPPVNHRSPPAARLFLTESWDFSQLLCRRPPVCLTARQSPACSFIYLGDAQIPAGDRLSTLLAACRCPPAPFYPCLHIFGGPTPLVTWIDDVSTYGRRLWWIGCSLSTYWRPPPLLTMVIDRYFLLSTLIFHLLSCLHSLRTMHGLSVGGWISSAYCIYH